MPEGGDERRQSRNAGWVQGGSSSPRPSLGLCCVGVRVRGGTGGLVMAPPRVCASAEVGEHGSAARGCLRGGKAQQRG